MTRRRDLDPYLSPVPLPQSSAPDGALAPYDPRLGGELPDEEIDLRRLWETLVCYRWTIFTVAAIVVVSTLAASLLMRPVYRATALVEISPSGRNPLLLDEARGELTVGRREYLETQFKILESEAVMDAVIARLDLVSNDEFAGRGLQRGFLNGVRELVGALADATRATRGDPAAVLERDWRLRRKFRSHLSVSPMRDSDLVRIGFDSLSPQLAAAAANAVVEEYVRLADTWRFSAMTGTRDFLEDQIALIETRLERSERELNQFAREHDIVDVDDHADLTGTRVSDLSSELTSAIQARIIAESLYRLVEEGKVEELQPILSSELVLTLKEEHARLSAEYQRLSGIYKRGYPKLQQLAAEMAQVRASQASEVRRLLAGIRADFSKARGREALLRAELEKETQALLDLKDRAVQYHILKREWETNQQLHAGLLEEMKRVGVSAGLGANRVSLIDRAKAPVKPHRPRPLRYSAVALLVGLGLGVALALLLAHLDDVLRTPRDLEDSTGLTSLGLLPELDVSVLEEGERLERLSHTRARNPIAQALRSVRTNVFVTSERVRILQITSAAAGEGKTTTAGNLAVVLAQRGSRVLLVDADLHKASLHQIFGVPPSPGLSEILAGESGVKLAETEVPNLVLLPAGDAAADPADLLGSANMDVFLEEVGSQFDYIVIDSPPVLGLADAALVGTKVDAVILVASAESTRKEAAREAVRRLRIVRSPLVGGVLNRASARSDRYGYYGAYGYAYAYGRHRGDETPSAMPG